MSKKSKLNKKRYGAFILISIALLVLFFVSINQGSLEVTVTQLFRGLFIQYDETVATIYNLRFPRVFVSMLAGSAVAVSGVLFQAVTKNSLADPTLIGVSSGASFVAVLITAFFPSLFFSIPLFAFLGGILAFTLVYSLSWKEGLRPLRLILMGVAVNALLTGLLDVVSTMGGGNVTGAASIVNANLTLKTWNDVKLLGVYTIVGLLGAIVVAGYCNLLALEDKTIRALGLRVNLIRVCVSVVAVLLASISTAVVGVIGFLGLVVPHIGRLLVGSDHKVLIPFSAVLGAFILLLADTVGRVIAKPYEIPASMIMSVIGGIVFILLLKRSKRV